jgi:hypothetical protein
MFAKTLGIILAALGVANILAIVALAALALWGTQIFAQTLRIVVIGI